MRASVVHGARPRKTPVGTRKGDAALLRDYLEGLAGVDAAQRAAMDDLVALSSEVGIKRGSLAIYTRRYPPARSARATRMPSNRRFLDTNVLVYLFDEEEPLKRGRALDLLRDLSQKPPGGHDFVVVPYSV